MKKVIAHRGAPLLAHENTMESFSIAIDFGADMIEFDVRRTKDNILVAHHDPFIQNNSERINISELKFDELEKIAGYQNFHIPRVKQILQSFSGKTEFDIELKEENCEQEVLDMISGLSVKPECLFTSFNHEILRKLKQIDISLKTGFLFEDIDKVKTSYTDSIDFLCPSYTTYLLNHDYFSDSLGSYSFAVWTINEIEHLKKLSADPLIDAVITNDTALAICIRNDYLNGETV